MNLKSWKLKWCGKKNEEKDQKKPEPVNSDNDHYLFLSFFETVALAPQVLSNQFAQILI